MKKLILIFLLLISFEIFAQKPNFIFDEFVECFYPQKITEPISIYSKPNGKIITKLKPLENIYCWYKFAISDSKKGWLKIENIIVFPGCKKNELNNNIEKYKGKWILAKNMEIFLPDLGANSGVEMNFYLKPDIKSKIVFIASDYLSTELIAVSGTWAKLKFIYKGKEIIGWLEKRHQCAYPWTNC
ncbi:hypothetical protein [Tenacibaculum ovolyticum]|uniref:hypothetical protein n=1 Tax=Tenacibaculum ovolyticum TaxID=104270 RepID=UPI0007ECA4E1|nr:hypothetical protein [Tenacibaculum ovolyticum]